MKDIQIVELFFQRAEEAIPPQRPNCLGGFMGRITRNLALNRLEYDRAQKRDSTLMETFTELNDSLYSTGSASRVT